MTPRAPVRRRSRRSGFSLVEVLAAMAVLVVGLTATTLIIATGVRYNRESVERNQAATLLPDAIADIQRRHFITQNMAVNQLGRPDWGGLFIETLQLDATGADIPTIHTASVGELNVGDVGVQFKDVVGLECFSKPGGSPTVAPFHVACWPLPKEPPHLMGFNIAEKGKSAGTPDGYRFRVVYSIHRHPEWQKYTIPSPGAQAHYDLENTASPSYGVYVLTLTVFRDLSPSSDPTRVVKLEQVLDPVSMYLRRGAP